MSGSEARAPDTISLEIDGIALTAPKGAMIIEVADEAGIPIPRFCYHKKLPIAANCRMCLVEVEKVPKPLPACATPISEGMKVYTRSQRAIEAQRGVMEFLLINHPLDCPICDQGGECELQDVAMGFGRSISRFTERKRVVRDKNLGPLIATDMTRCIHCTRCIRTLEVVAGQKELGATGRGENTQIGTYIETNVNSEMSGNVIDVCPVGALTSKPFRYSARAWELRQHESIAPHDCIGSNTYLHTYQNRVMRVVPRENEAINEVWISDRDRFSYEGLNCEQRLRTPMVKTNGVWAETDWETALETVAMRLNEIRAIRGPEQIGALVSPTATLEEMYLLQKLMRGLGSNNIDHRLRESSFGDQDALPAFPWLGQSIADLEALDAALLIGSNIRKEQPIAAHRLLKASGAGAKLMVVNPIDYDFAFPVAAKVIVNPGAMIGALSAMVRALAEHTGKAVPDAVAALVADVDCDERQRTMATALADSGRVSVLFGSIASMHPQACTLRALAAAMAELAEARLGFLPEGGNAAGGWFAGVLPHRGPGGRKAGSPGLDVSTMLAQQLKAYLLVNTEPEYDCADPVAATAAMAAADFVVGLTAFRSEALARDADVLLPIAPFSEAPGTVVNVEGRWQSFEAAVDPLGDTRPGWKVLRVLGNLFDVEGFQYMSIDEVRQALRDEVGDLAPDNHCEFSAGPTDADLTDGPLMRVGDVPIYAVDGIVRRATSLQETADGCEAMAAANAAEAERQGIARAERIQIKQTAEWVAVPFTIDARVPNGCIWIPSGVPGSEKIGPAFGPVEVKAG